MTAYCQTCGTRRSACTCGADRSTILESLGFTSTPIRRRSVPATPLPPVPTSVSAAVPVRSTTALVEELWEAEEPLGDFPPPLAPAIAHGATRPTWSRMLVTAVILSLVGVGAHLGTMALLEGYTSGLVSDAEASLAQVRTHAVDVELAAATIGDPAADAVALSAAATVITALEDDARLLRALADPDPGWPELVGLRVADPVAGWRSAASVVSGRAADLADELSTALTTRLLIEQLPALPDLPNGADDGTIEAIEADLVSSISVVRSDLARYEPTLSADVGPVLDGWEAAAGAYVAALRSHDPGAEALAGEVVAGHGVLLAVTSAWVEDVGTRLGPSASAYRDAVASIG